VPALLRVLWTVCAIVGAVVLYCGLMAGLWTTCVRLVRRAGAARAPAAAGSGLDAMAAGLAEMPELAGLGGMPAAAESGDSRDRRAQSWHDLPPWLFRDRPWAVAVVLLGAAPIRDRTAGFVDFQARRIDWNGLVRASATWPAADRLMVMTAYELAFDTATEVEQAVSEPVTLTDLVRLLDDDEVERVRVAMDVSRGRVEVGEALTRLG
jgi:hypothetical protein